MKTQISTQQYTYFFSPSEQKVISIVGRFYKIRAVSLTGATFTIRRDTNSSGGLAGLSINQGEIADFTVLTITNESSLNAVQLTILVGDNTFLDTNMQISSAKVPVVSNGAVLPVRVTPNGAGQVLFNTNSTRQWFLVQNTDPAVTIWLIFTGGAGAAVGNGIRLRPGEVYEMAGVIYTGPFSFIAEAAGAANSIIGYEAG